jgi:glucan phosphoethanolaminetransferase (alkaline phosphatase superfamily)
MDSVFGLLAIIILGIAVLATVIYLILKAASYFKRSFGVSLWPGVIALCFSVDIAVFTTAAGQNMGHEFIIVMYIVAGLLLAYTLYRPDRARIGGPYL